jgi:hypothetical protein
VSQRALARFRRFVARLRVDERDDGMVDAPRLGSCTAALGSIERALVRTPSESLRLKGQDPHRVLRRAVSAWIDAARNGTLMFLSMAHRSNDVTSRRTRSPGVPIGFASCLLGDRLRVHA